MCWHTALEAFLHSPVCHPIPNARLVHDLAGGCRIDAPEFAAQLIHEGAEDVGFARVIASPNGSQNLALREQSTAVLHQEPAELELFGRQMEPFTSHGDGV